jgi:hypothetical protein
MPVASVSQTLHVINRPSYPLDTTKYHCGRGSDQGREAYFWASGEPLAA